MCRVFFNVCIKGYRPCRRPQESLEYNLLRTGVGVMGFLPSALNVKVMKLTRSGKTAGVTMTLLR